MRYFVLISTLIVFGCRKQLQSYIPQPKQTLRYDSVFYLGWGDKKIFKGVILHDTDLNKQVKGFWNITIRRVQGEGDVIDDGEYLIDKDTCLVMTEG